MDYRTRIYRTEPGKVEYLMNEIHSTSRFQNTPWPKAPDGISSADWVVSAEPQRRMAEDIINGWKTNGCLPIGTTFRIEQEDLHAPAAARTGGLS